MRQVNHVVDGLLVGWPLFAVSPVFLGYLVPLVGDFQTLLKSFQLFFLTDVDPEFAQHTSVLNKLILKRVDFLISPLPLIGLGKSLYPLN